MEKMSFQNFQMKEYLDELLGEAESFEEIEIMYSAVKTYEKIRLMYQDEASFGRINKPKHCWCPKGMRPCVPCHHIREYRYIYGAVDPHFGDSHFFVAKKCNTENMNSFLGELSEKFENDYIILVVDGASWHKAKALKIPKNIEFIFLPPYTPELNPIEQIWAWIRLHGFRNEVFASLLEVMNRLDSTINLLSHDIIKSITYRKWMLHAFY